MAYQLHCVRCEHDFEWLRPNRYACPNCGSSRWRSKLRLSCPQGIPRYERFWQKVNKLEGCWEFLGAKGGGGYGFFRWDGKSSMVAHRAAWILTKGAIPKGKLLCHRCDNRKCVRPDHMFIGTSQDNSNDAVKKGRMARGERNRGVKLKEGDVIKIRFLMASHSRKDVATMFGVCEGTVKAIWNRHTWAYL